MRVRYFPHRAAFDVDGIIALPLDVDWQHVSHLHFALRIRGWLRRLGFRHRVP